MNTCTIGREGNNTINLYEPTVSRNHGVFEFHNDGSVFYEDLNSSNGSFVNGNRMYGKIQLKSTDILKLGKTLVPWQEYRALNSAQSNSDVYNNQTVVDHQSNFSFGTPDETQQETKAEEPPILMGDVSMESPKKGCLTKSRMVVWIVVLAVVGIIGLVVTRNKKSEEVSQNENTTKSDTSIVAHTPQNPTSDDGDRLVFKDSDNDGVDDDKDGCPQEKGPKANNGCPYADYDRDGVPDKDDLCKYVSGPKYNDGCPYEEESYYRTQCPYCDQLSYQSTSDKRWRCGDCGETFYNCYRNSEGDHDGIKLEWFNDGTCDCSLTCADE